MNPPSVSLFTALAHRLALIVAGLKLAVVARRGRDRAVGPLVLLLLGRLSRLVMRFEVLVANLVAGRLPLVPRVRAARVRADRARGPQLPGGRFWLIRLLPGEVARYGSQLQVLLAAPEMADFLALAPGAGRMLRPLSRMLGIPLGPPLGVAVAVDPGKLLAGPPRDGLGRFMQPVVQMVAVAREYVAPMPLNLRFLMR